MKKYFLLFLLFVSFSGYAQNTLNNYKYVIVPEKFNFLKQDDQYKLNTLLKALLNDKGFVAYLDNTELPVDLAGNKCNALSADVQAKNGMFTTNLTILLKDCRGNIIFKTKEGKSREKEYKVSYNAALRDAFTSIEAVQYAYSGPASTDNAVAVPVTAPAAAVVTTPVAAAVSAPANNAVVKAAVAVPVEVAGTLYAQATANGYQLIDTAPKIILTLYKTSVQDYFIAGNGTANGIVFRKSGSWYFEYYKGTELVAEKLLIKF